MEKKKIHVYVLSFPLKESICQAMEIWCCSLTERKSIVVFIEKKMHFLILKSENSFSWGWSGVERVGERGGKWDGTQKPTSNKTRRPQTKV